MVYIFVFHCVTVQAENLAAQERGLSLDRTPLAKTDWVPHESPPVRSLNLSLTFTQTLRVGFVGRIQKRIFDLRSYGFFTTKKTEDPKKDHFP